MNRIATLAIVNDIETQQLSQQLQMTSVRGGEKRLSERTGEYRGMLR